MAYFLQCIFYVVCIGVMCLVGCAMLVTRKLQERQLEQIELQIQKLKPNIEE